MEVPAALDPTSPGGETACAVPSYLSQTYWWAYVHPRAVQTFERDWLVNTILFGNYSRLRDTALEALGPAPLAGRTLQMACVYGNLTARLCQRLAGDARLDVVDILPIQLGNLRRKLPPDDRVTLLHGDASGMGGPSARYDRVLLFFLLHEQPEPVRRATLAEALRLLAPGGQLVVMDYHQPSRWHPMRALMRWIFRRLEPFAMDLWRHELATFLPADANVQVQRHEFFFGRLYQLWVLRRL